jgi:hypothetical protein
MLQIKIVPQKREFGCAKAVINTIIKTKYGKEVEIKDPFLHIGDLGTLRFLSMANDVLREHALKGRFVKKTNVKCREMGKWLSEEKLMIVLFISRENYPHYAVVAGVEEEKITIANTHGAKLEKFHTTEFIERFYLNTRYIESIQWMKGQTNHIMDRIVRYGIRFAKIFGIIKPGTIYILDE